MAGQSIEELLETARLFVGLAQAGENSNLFEMEKRHTYSSIAIAAAQTAQAMMDFEMRQEFFEKSQPEASGIIEF